MLHKLHRPNDIELRNVMAFQRDLLAFACDPHISRPADTAFDRAQVESKFVARWPTFWQSIYHGKLTAFGTAIKNLNDMVRGNNALASAVLNAYDNDVQFDTRFNDPTFAFQFPTLPTNVRDELKTILVQFYTWFSGDGFSASVTQLSGFQRRQLVERFVTANASINVCPACDGPRADRDESRVHASTDHYFPKDKYPPLSIHPKNLVPMCRYCNEDYKKTNDPADKASVSEMFLPYLREAFGPIKASVQRNTRMQIEVLLHDRGVPSTPRIDALEHLFRISQRWATRAEDYAVPHMFQNMRDLARSRRRHGELIPLEDDVSETIADQRGDFAANKGRSPYHLLFEAYADFVLRNDGELQTIINECLGL